MADSDLQMPLLEHLRELRVRLIRSIIGLCVGFAVAYFFRVEIFEILTGPYDEAYRKALNKDPVMITTGIMESFMVYLKVALVGGIFLASPYLFAQVWQFIAPGLRAKERKYVIPFVLLATAFFVGGSVFGYFVVFPVGFEYFLALSPPNYIQPMIRMQEYFGFAAWMLLVFGISFEFPLIALYLAAFGVLKPHHLTKPWRGIIVGIMVACAVLTPSADPASMLLMAAPLTFLYGVTILASFFVARPRKTETAIKRDEGTPSANGPG